MRPLLLALAIALALLPGCKRAKPVAQAKLTSKSNAGRPSEPAQENSPEDRGQLNADRDAGPAIETGNPGPAGEPQPAGLPDSPQRPMPPNPEVNRPTGQGRPSGASRGNLVIAIYGTPLDYRLDALFLGGATFRLQGQGMCFVGRMSNDWQSSLGRSVAIEPSLGSLYSELDLPMIGMVRITSGELVLDEAVRGQPGRVKGRLRFTLPGPEGPSSFSGTFEVGVVTK